MSEVPFQPPIQANVADIHETRQALQQVKRWGAIVEGRLFRLEDPLGFPVVDAANVTYAPEEGTLGNWDNSEDPGNANDAFDQLAERDMTAIHDDIAGEIAAIDVKAAPVSGDYALIEDSADSNAKKHMTLGGLVTGLNVATSGANLTDEAIIVGDGGAKGVKTGPLPTVSGQGLLANGSAWVAVNTTGSGTDLVLSTDPTFVTRITTPEVNAAANLALVSGNDLAITASGELTFETTDGELAIESTGNQTFVIISDVDRLVSFSRGYGVGAVDVSVDRNIIVGGTVDGVDIAAHAANGDAHHAEAHKDTHDPEDGGDPLDTAAAAAIAGVQVAGIGTAHSFARSDHAHEIVHSKADNALVTVDDADAAENDYAKFTAAGGLAGRSYTEVASDLNAVTAAATIDDTAIVVGDGGTRAVKKTGITIDASDNINVASGAFVVSTEEILEFHHNASADSWVRASNNVAGTEGVKLAAQGAANCDMVIASNGTGAVRLTSDPWNTIFAANPAAGINEANWIQVDNATAGNAAVLKSIEAGSQLKLTTTTNGDLLLDPDGTGDIDVNSNDVKNIVNLNDTNDNEVIKFVATASAVNEISITNAAAAGNVKIEATGTDTNIALELTPKGSDPLVLHGQNWPTSAGADGKILFSDGSHAVWEDIDDLTADADPDGAVDYVMTYDASNTAHRKVLVENLPGGVDRRIFYIKEATATDAHYPLWSTAQKINVTKIYGETDVGTVTFDIEYRAEGSAFSSGTEIIGGAHLVAIDTGDDATVDVAIAANQFLTYVASAQSGATTHLVVYIEYNVLQT
jgi:hypothetical protein